MILLAVLSVFAPAPCPAFADDAGRVSDQTVWSYSYTGAVQTFTAPADGAYKLEVWGAQGGTVYGYAGGLGGYVTGTVELKKGDTLYIAVGGQGARTVGANNAAGGWNGGGSAQYNGNQNTTPYRSDENPASAGSGGGASSISSVLSGDGQIANYESEQNDIAIVAGGGGGNIYWPRPSNPSSYAVPYGQHGIAGDGGGDTGTDGAPGDSYYDSHTGGAGGSQSAGGSHTALTSYDQGKLEACTYVPGSFGQGGHSDCINGSAGGGGGWYGGGASIDNAGGGGGSGHINADKVSDGAMQTGVNEGNGKAVVTYLTFTVRFDPNGGTGSMADETFNGASQALTPNAFIGPKALKNMTSSDFTFSGWNTKADGTGTAFSDGQVIQNIEHDAAGNVTLYAQWRRTDISVSINMMEPGATRESGRGAASMEISLDGGKTWIGSIVNEYPPSDMHVPLGSDIRMRNIKAAAGRHVASVETNLGPSFGYWHCDAIQPLADGTYQLHIPEDTTADWATINVFTAWNTMTLRYHGFDGKLMSFSDAAANGGEKEHIVQPGTWTRRYGDSVTGLGERSSWNPSEVNFPTIMNGLTAGYELDLYHWGIGSSDSAALFNSQNKYGTVQEEAAAYGYDLSSGDVTVDLYARQVPKVYTVSIPTRTEWSGMSAGKADASTSYDVKVSGDFDGTVKVSGSQGALTLGNAALAADAASRTAPLSFTATGTKQDTVNVTGSALLVGKYAGTVGYTVENDL